MRIHRYQLLRGSLVALLLGGSCSLCAHAQEEAANPKSPEASPSGGSLSEEGAAPMRGVLNSFSQAVNDWYTSAYPQLQKYANANLSHLPYGGNAFKFPGFTGPPPVPIPSQGPGAMLPGHGGPNAEAVFLIPPRINSTNAESEKGNGENAEAEATLAAALNAFHQYVDNFINSLAVRLSPFMVHYTPAGFFPFLPGLFPVPFPPPPPKRPDYILPSPIDPPCPPGDDKCSRLPLEPADAEPPHSGPTAAPPLPAPEVDMTAILELLSRFGGKLSSSHIVTLQPFMEQYIAKLSAKSKAALQPLLFQYWPQLFPSADEGATQPGAPVPLARA